MIPYRLLPPAEEEMTEAALFYEAAAAGLGDDSLDDVQHAIDSVRGHPEPGTTVAYGFRRVLVRRFHSASSMQPSRRISSSSLSPTSGALRNIGENAHDC